MLDVVAGFDIGGTKISLVVADSSGDSAHRSIEPTDSASGAIEHTAEHTVYRGVARQLERMLRTALLELQRPRLAAIGIVSAGPIRNGGLWSPPNIVPIGIIASRRELPRFIPLVDPLQQAFCCPVGILNDCNGAVLGEVYDGLGKDTPDKSTLHLAYATISTGFGVGVWEGGRLVLGKDGNAGELGHIVVHQDGLPCGCGNRGCVEAYSSGSGIVRNARTRLLDLEDTERGGSVLVRLALGSDARATSPPRLETALEDMTPALVFEAAQRRDPVAQAVIDDAIFAAGIAFSAIANAYDPAIISVGGGIAIAHPELVDPIQREMLRHLNVEPPEVRLSPLGTGVTEHGAIALARRLLPA